MLRRAARGDLPDIVRMLADDALGSRREAYAEPLPASYVRAFEAIDADPNNELLVADIGGRAVGVLQLTYVPYLTYQGSWRALIEGVRVDSALRACGLGRKLLEHAIERARLRGCRMVQLTSNKARADAIGFYEKLGFVASHEGLKLELA